MVHEVLSKQLGIQVQEIRMMDKIEFEEDADRELFEKNQGALSVAMGLCLRDA